MVCAHASVGIETVCAKPVYPASPAAPDQTTATYLSWFSPQAAYRIKPIAL